MRYGPAPRKLDRRAGEQDIECMLECAGSSLRLKMEARGCVGKGEPLVYGLAGYLLDRAWRSKYTRRHHAKAVAMRRGE